MPRERGNSRRWGPHTHTHPLSACFCIQFLILPVSRRSSHCFSRYFTWTSLSTELPSDLAEWRAVDGTNFYQLPLGWCFLTHQAILWMPDRVNGAREVPQGVCGLSASRCGFGVLVTVGLFRNIPVECPSRILSVHPFPFRQGVPRSAGPREESQCGGRSQTWPWPCWGLVTGEEPIKSKQSILKIHKNLHAYMQNPTTQTIVWWRPRGGECRGEEVNGWGGNGHLWYFQW